MKLWKNRWIWFGSSATLCFCTVFHGFYFDYSDRWLHTSFALLLLALAFWLPRVSTYVLLSWLILVALACSMFHELSSSERPTRGTARSHVITGVVNYVWYTVTLEALLDGAPWLTGTVRVMPTDQIIYLPVVFKN